MTSHEVIKNKLESLRRCLTRIEEHQPTTVQALRKNLDSQDVIMLNIERAVQMCVDIAAHILSENESRPPATYAESFHALRDAKVISANAAHCMFQAVGFRNIAVHEYTEINWKIVFNIVVHNLKDFKLFASEIMTWLARLEKKKRKKRVRKTKKSPKLS